jgi:hypothetical protein
MGQFQTSSTGGRPIRVPVDAHLLRYRLGLLLVAWWWSPSPNAGAGHVLARLRCQTRKRPCPCFALAEPDQGRQVARHQARILRELPTLADLLCLAVTAGEGPRAALERTVARSGGALSQELALVLADLRAGEPFTTAIERLAVRVPVPAVVRFVDGLVVAVERGTPLGDVLRAQAADVREQHKRDLIEAGGRREVLMLVPSSIGLEASGAPSATADRAAAAGPRRRP